jgi:tRNA pseudouridine38-40 synthase
VHALGQVVHVDLSDNQAKRIKSGLPKKLNAMLARDIRVSSIVEAPQGFHARFSATSREYRYRINQSKFENPLTGRYQLWHKQSLDAELMHEAGQKLIGLHDFAAFCKPRAGSTTIREMKKLVVSQTDDEIIIDLEAPMPFVTTRSGQLLARILVCCRSAKAELSVEEFIEF